MAKDKEIKEKEQDITQKKEQDITSEENNENLTQEPKEKFSCKYHIGSINTGSGSIYNIHGDTVNFYQPQNHEQIKRPKNQNPPKKIIKIINKEKIIKIKIQIM